MNETNRGKIFVSYRREGGQELARLILDHLNFRGYDVFLDTESLGGGTFNTKLLQRIRESSDFVLILTPGALDRCVNKSDWVRKELACALKNGVNVVPVFAKGFTFESAGPLPEDIKDVADYNGPTVNYEYFNAFIDKLEDFLTAKCMEDPYAAPEKKKKQTSPAKKQSPSRLACRTPSSQPPSPALLSRTWPWRPSPERSSQCGTTFQARYLPGCLRIGET